MFKKFLLCGAFVGATLLQITVANAAVIATAQADVDGNKVKEIIELHGNKIAQNGDYYTNLMLFIKNSDGSIKTAYEPNIKGGYGAVLEIYPVLDQKERILLSVPQGSYKAPVEYRIYDIDTSGNVKVLFDQVDNMGMAVQTKYLPDKKIETQFSIDGQNLTNTIKIDDEIDMLGIYDGAGNVKKSYIQPKVENIYSLTYSDDLYGVQNIKDESSNNVLGKVYTVWKMGDDDKWYIESARIKASSSKPTRVNASADKGKWQIHPQDWIDTSIPLIYVSGKPEIQNKINEKITKWIELSKDVDERAYRIDFAGPELLSMHLFRKEEGQVPLETIYNFDMKTGELVSLNKMFDVKNKDFLELIKVLGDPKPEEEINKLPNDWYYVGSKFVFTYSEAKEHQEELLKERVEIGVPAIKLYSFVKEKTLPAE